MFAENFSFDTPRSPSLDSSTSNTSSIRDTSRSVSPCSVVAPYHRPRLSISDLASQLAGQRLHQPSLICYDSCEAYANLDDDAGWEIENEPFAPSRQQQAQRCPQRPTRPHSPSQRLQRQANARLLCNATHQRDVTALVSRMVESNDQCSVVVPDSLGLARLQDDDEGYDSGEGSPPMQSSQRQSSRPKLKYRRSSDMKSTMGACVSKNVRIRKDRSSQHVRMKSSEKAQ